MAANDRSTSPTLLEAQAVLALAVKVENLDSLCQERSESLVALIDAIGRLSNDDTVRNLAVQARTLAQEFGDDVNVFAEEMGFNHKGGKSFAQRLYGVVQ